MLMGVAGTMSMLATSSYYIKVCWNGRSIGDRSECAIGDRSEVLI